MTRQIAKAGTRGLSQQARSARVGVPEAMAGLANLAVWLPNAWLEEGTQDQWAESIAAIPDIVYGDLLVANRRIAEREKPERWRLELSEIKAAVKLARDDRIRVEQQRAGAQRPQLPARATPDPEASLRARVALEIAEDVAARRIYRLDDVAFANEMARRLALARAGQPTRSRAPDPEGGREKSRRRRTATRSDASNPELEMTPEQVRARQSELVRQAEQLRREEEAAMRDAIAISPTKEERGEVERGRNDNETGS